MRADSNARKIAAGYRPTLGTLRIPRGPQLRDFPIPQIHGQPNVRGMAITAAATLLSDKKVDRSIRKPQTESWQQDAWELRDEIGEIRYLVDRQARGVSQVRLFVGIAEGADATPARSDDPLAQDLQELLFGSRAATEQMLKRCAQHLALNGDSILHAKQDGHRIAIFARSIQELGGSPGSWTFTDGNGGTEPVDPDTELVIRCWTPHPQWYGRADAPVRAVLPVARELRGLTQFVSAQIDSRLAGAGVLKIPNGISSIYASDEDGYDFGEEITDYFTVPIKDRDSAASVVPFVLRGDPEQLKEVQHISFGTPLDEHAAELRDESVRRIGLGMDSDPSILLGQGSGSHWSAWEVSANEVRYGIEPLASVICHALTVGLLRPLVEQRGEQDPERWQVWYDVSGLKVRDDRSKDAQALFDKQLVSAGTVRAENGFADSDAPDEREVEQARLWHLLQMRPDLTGVILPRLGIDLGPIAPQPSGQDAPAPQQPGAGIAKEAPDGPPVMGETEATQ